ncbi:MAG TPA: reverse transcriptase domain-containing protein [Gemmataceae bacterium]|nr:reverse transcriptase domain-containing protein [Gemmataceae bacterium]
MKRYGDLWPLVVSWANLVHAARKARRGKRDRGVVLRFDFDLERELLQLQRELIAEEYRPGAFTTHWITRPKPRLISAAPYRDRVVHHAVLNVLEPILDRHFHPDSYACRSGKGTHAAAQRLQQLMRRYRYTLQCDVRKFFPSIDHAILKERFRRVVKDRRLLGLMDLIVDSSNDQERVMCWFPGDELFTPATRRKGLPIGNLTSQWFANWYLTALDHQVGNEMRLGYVRYCDDFILLANDKSRLKAIVPELVERLASARLVLHRDRTHVAPSRAGRTFVGFRVTPASRRIRNGNVRSFLRRLRWMRRAFRSRQLSQDDVQRRLMGWLGHAAQADSLPLIAKLASGWVFVHGHFRRFH